MEIKASELRNGVEVDLPINWKTRTQDTIKYIQNINRYVISDIRTGEVHYMSPSLSDVVVVANKTYPDTNDVAVED